MFPVVKRWSLALIVTILAALTAAQAQAGTVAANLTSPGSTYGGGQYTLGFEFTAKSAITVTDLGVWDDEADGLRTSAQVGLWDSLGNLLASTTIPSGTGATLVDSFRYGSIAPLALTPGVNYIVGAYTQDLATSFNTGQGGSGFYAPEINAIRDRYSPFTGNFSFPSATDNHAQGAWLGGNLIYSATAAVPEPSTIASALVAGAMCLGYSARRRRAK